MMKNLVLDLLLKMSAAMRRKRLATLLEYFEFRADTKILDVGGAGDWDWRSFGIEAPITSLNLYPPEDVDTPHYIQGDARNMDMFVDDAFDLVISNSVIEHLPSREDQRLMAAEIQRVGKSYWVQTPNKHFPLELHLCFPFVQYWPVKWRIAFAKVWPFSFEMMRGHTDGAVADAQVILLTKRQLRLLFPGAKIIGERFMGMTKSLIAVSSQKSCDR